MKDHQDIYTVIKQLVDSGQESTALAMEREVRKKNPGAKFPSVITERELNKLITINTHMLELKDAVRLLALENDPVLIVGPTGTGKEIIARALHGSREGRFVAINCTALSDDLIESELYGHKKGSFTGALEDRIGRLKYANNGTVFLDEIGDMPISMQTKLLRFLNDGTFYPVGSNVEDSSNTRIVAATNRNVEDMLKDKSFRQDLYWRIAVFILRTLSLLERPEDIEPIARANGYTDSMEKLTSIEWSGNVRELIARIRRHKILTLA